jgi:hypothetical protein
MNEALKGFEMVSKGNGQKPREQYTEDRIFQLASHEPQGLEEC